MLSPELLLEKQKTLQIELQIKIAHEDTLKTQQEVLKEIEFTKQLELKLKLLHAGMTPDLVAAM